MQRNPYPVTYELARPQRYNRAHVLFRFILVVPLYLLISGFSGEKSASGFSGPLSELLLLLAVFAWFTIIFTGRFPEIMRNTAEFLFRWTLNIEAYFLLLTDPYPPFGSGPYPVTVGITPAEQYNRWSVAFRWILVIPHVVVLIFLGIALLVTTFIAWFAILFTGEYPHGMYEFAVGVNRWGARVGAYAYLLVDEYPPFTLAAEPGDAGLQPAPA